MKRKTNRDMITTTGTNFLKHVFSESISDLANIVEAEARDDKEILIDYLTTIKGYIDKWINEITEL